VAARKIIAKGCVECPDNEDVWLENARLQVIGKEMEGREKKRDRGDRERGEKFLTLIV